MLRCSREAERLPFFVLNSWGKFVNFCQLGGLGGAAHVIGDGEFDFGNV
jgi:hypothetical protein